MKVYNKESDLNQKIVTGVKKLAEAVGTTLGPKGRNVIIQQKGKMPFVTKDGASVSSHIEFEDPFENIALLVREKKIEGISDIRDESNK